MKYRYDTLAPLHAASREKYAPSFASVGSTMSARKRFIVIIDKNTPANLANSSIDFVKKSEYNFFNK